MGEGEGVAETQFTGRCCCREVPAGGKLLWNISLDEKSWLLMLKMGSRYREVAIGVGLTVIQTVAKRTLTIQLHSHGYVIIPCYRKDSNVTSFNCWIELVRHNCVHVRVSLKDLSEIKKKTLSYLYLRLS